MRRIIVISVLLFGCGESTQTAGFALLDDTASWTEGNPPRTSWDAAWGDVNADGFLDVVLGADGGTIDLYLSEEGTLPGIPSWSATNGGDVHSLAWGDMDGDGDLDLAAGMTDDGAIRIYTNDAGVLLEPPDELTLAGLNQSVAWADFDGDADLDLAVASETANDVIFENNGFGPTTTPLWTAPAADDTGELAAADWDGDGDVDLASATRAGGGSTRIYQTTNTTLLALHQTVSRDQFTALAWGDVNGDGLLDLLFADESGAANELYEATAGDPASIDLVPDWTGDITTATRSAALVDLDSDGDLDAFFGNLDGTTEEYDNQDGQSALIGQGNVSQQLDDAINRVAWADADNDGDQDALLIAEAALGSNDSLFLNDGFNIAEGTMKTSATTSPTDIEVGDLDGDGDHDVAIAHAGGVTIEFLEDGGFQSTTTLATGPAEDIDLGDVDGDGDLDLAVATSPPSVWENEGGVFTELWSSSSSATVMSVLWLDFQADGDLDLYVGTDGLNEPYLAQNGVLDATPTSGNSSTTPTPLLARGDLDGNGELDLVLAGPSLVVAYNNGGDFGSTPDSTGLTGAASALALEDFNGDGLLDIAVASGSTVTVWWNNGLAFFTTSEDFDNGGDVGSLVPVRWANGDDLYLGTGPAGSSTTMKFWQRIGLNDWKEVWTTDGPSAGFMLGPAGDWDGDGDLDLVLDDGAYTTMGANGRIRAPDLPNNPTYPTLAPPAGIALGGAQGPPLVGEAVTLTLTLFDAESDPAPLVRLEGRAGADDWAELTLSSGDATLLDSSPTGVEHQLVWDITADGIEGDAVQVRAVVVYQSPRKVAFPIRHGAITSPAVGPLRIHVECLGASDFDGDGWTCDEDCDDADANVHPTAFDACADGFDADCSGEFGPDADYDGYHDIDCGGTDCDDTDPTVNTDGVEITCDGIDQDCLDGDATLDVDLDGVDCSSDCDDVDAVIYPSAPELCDGSDNDCDGVVPADEVDDDGDDYVECSAWSGDTTIIDGGDDCDDTNDDRWPGAAELCDGLDDDCDGSLDPDEVDGDNDGSVPCAEVLLPLALIAGDCDDTDASIAPHLPEVCDGVDNNCDGALPDDEQDVDGDGVRACDDCDDGNAENFPGNTEACDTADNDCDGDADEGLDHDNDGDGYLSDGSCSAQEDCDDDNEAIYDGAEEICDHLDSDCDGQLGDLERDLDEDRHTECGPFNGEHPDIDGGGDCDDLDPTRAPSFVEVCDWVDNDCDGNLPSNEADQDNDGYMGCNDADETDNDDGDCDDYDATVHPYAAELCDGLDTDCDGQALDDEGNAEADADGDTDPACRDCDETDPTVGTHVGVEQCDGRDDDCDGAVDENFDPDADGYSDCFGELDCNNGDENIHPGVVDLCDTLDNDCDGLVDEDDDSCEEVPAPGLSVTCSYGGASGILLLPLVLARRRRR